MKKHFLHYIPIVILILLLSTCKEKGMKNMREGEVYYNIKYINNPTSLSSDFLPREMVISFRNDLIATSLKAPFGNSGISSIINPKEHIYDTYLNLLSFKYYCEGTSRDIQPGFSSMEGITFSETGRKSVICGFNCRQVRVTIPGSKTTRYIWYTNDIKVEGPNRLTPYSEIDGVLMDFFYILGKAELQFTADEVFAREIPDKVFEQKQNYKKVTRSFMDSIIQKMMAF